MMTALAEHDVADTLKIFEMSIKISDNLSDYVQEICRAARKK